MVDELGIYESLAGGLVVKQEVFINGIEHWYTSVELEELLSETRCRTIIYEKELRLERRLSKNVKSELHLGKDDIKILAHLARVHPKPLHARDFVDFWPSDGDLVARENLSRSKIKRLRVKLRHDKYKFGPLVLTREHKEGYALSQNAEVIVLVADRITQINPQS
jgi:DNA-binding winged helix-turn-helix (wHTH) protein